MTNYDVHSTLFLKYLRVNRRILLLLSLIICIHFLLLLLLPDNRKPVTDGIWIFSEIVKISLSVMAFRDNRDSVKRAWLFLTIYGLFTLSGILIRTYYDLFLNIYTVTALPHYLFASGNIALIIAFIMFSHSDEPSFKIRRQMNLTGLIFTSILIISFMINYNTSPVFTPIVTAIRTAVFGIINISAFVIGLGIYWTGIWKKDFKRKHIFRIILFSTFISFILNNLFYVKIIITGESVTGGFPDLLGTAAILLVSLAAWDEKNYKEDLHTEESYSLFYVSRIERIIPVLTLVTMLTVLFFNLSKLDSVMIQVIVFMMIPYCIFLLFFELYSYRAEDALLSILSVSPTGIHITDRGFTKTYFMNKSLFDMFRSSDITPDLILGNGIKEEEKNIIINSVSAKRSIDNIEMVLKRADGTKFNAQCRIVPARYYSYDVLILWIWDITERKNYEGTILKQKYSAEIASLYKSELLDNLSNRIQSGYVTMKPDANGWPDFILTGMNRRVLELFNFKEDLTGERLRKVFPDPDPGLVTRFFEVLNNGVSIKRELKFPEIGKIFLFLIFRASEDEVACLIDDITKQKEAEAILRESEIKEKEIEKAVALGQMAGGIAHDLNNRLMGISSYTSLIDMKVKDANIKKYTDGIQDSIVKSTELIENLLIFARQSDFLADVFSIHNMLREMSLKAVDEFPEDIKLESLFNAADADVKGDYKQLYKAVFDIILNAKDAMSDGGEITITTENKTIDNALLSDLTKGDADKLFIVVKISDSGYGIEKENISRIFDPFYTTKPVGKGKGLGLSAVYGTIQAHHGAITVDSVPGKGTTFSIYLPVF